MKNVLTLREQIVETVNRLFVYTDYQDWDNLQLEVFADKVLVDMASMGAAKAELLDAKEVCLMWQKGFEGLDAIHHQAGNYIIKISDEVAEVTAYSIASHFKAAAKNGNTREFVGSYDLHLSSTKNGWRIDQFKYNLKYMTGNADLI